MTTTPKEAFHAAYMLELARQHAAKPEAYLWPASELSSVAEKMLCALAAGSANIDSPAVRFACKLCKLKPGIARIKAFLACATWEAAMTAGLVQ